MCVKYVIAKAIDEQPAHYAVRGSDGLTIAAVSHAAAVALNERSANKAWLRGANQ
jgi:hypothetical protein